MSAAATPDRRVRGVRGMDADVVLLGAGLAGLVATAELVAAIVGSRCSTG